MTHARRVTGFVNLAHLIDHMAMLVFPTAVLGMAADFGQSYGELLTLSLGGFIAFGAGSLPAGWLGDLWSRRNMLALFFIGIGSMLVLTGLSRAPLALAAGLTMVGLFGAIYHPVGTAMLTAHAERIGREIGVNGVWGNLGVALAALATGGLTQYFGWRVAFFVPGAVAIAAGLAFLALVPDRPAPPKPADARGVALPRTTMLRIFLILAGVTAASGLVFNATTISLPKVLNERLLSLVSSPFGISILVACVYSLGATAQLLVGRLLDRFPLRRVFIALAILQAPSLWFASDAGGWPMLAVSVVMMFSIFGQVTINDAMVARYTSEAWRARAYALRYLVSFGASATAVPLIAYLHDRGGGFAAMFAVLAGFAILVLIGAALLPRQAAPANPTAKASLQPAE